MGSPFGRGRSAEVKRAEALDAAFAGLVEAGDKAAQCGVVECLSFRDAENDDTLLDSDAKRHRTGEESFDIGCRAPDLDIHVSHALGDDFDDIAVRDEHQAPIEPLGIDTESNNEASTKKRSTELRSAPPESSHTRREPPALIAPFGFAVPRPLLTRGIPLRGLVTHTTPRCPVVPPPRHFSIRSTTPTCAPRARDSLGNFAKVAGIASADEELWL